MALTSLPISTVWMYQVQNSRASGHQLTHSRKVNAFFSRSPPLRLLRTCSVRPPAFASDFCCSCSSLLLNSADISSMTCRITYDCISNSSQADSSFVFIPLERVGDLSIEKLRLAFVFNDYVRQYNRGQAPTTCPWLAHDHLKFGGYE